MKIEVNNLFVVLERKPARRGLAIIRSIVAPTVVRAATVDFLKACLRYKWVILGGCHCSTSLHSITATDRYFFLKRNKDNSIMLSLFLSLCKYKSQAH